MQDRRRARELASQYIAQGDPTGWFEALYREGEAGKSVVPWSDRGPNPRLLDFWALHPQESTGKKALVIGCGYGDDAERLAGWGFDTTAFDIAETAIREARKRFPASGVEYHVSDLFHPPTAWDRAFDFVLEANTVQALPLNLRSEAIRHIASFVAPGGRLLAILRARDAGEPVAELPWPLTRAEMDEFLAAGLRQESFEDFLDDEDPPTRRFRALYSRM